MAEDFVQRENNNYGKSKKQKQKQRAKKSHIFRKENKKTLDNINYNNINNKNTDMACHSLNQ